MSTPRRRMPPRSPRSSANSKNNSITVTMTRTRRVNIKIEVESLSGHSYADVIDARVKIRTRPGPCA